MKKIIIAISILLIAMISMAYLYFSTLHRQSGQNDLSLNTAASHSGLIFSFDQEKSFYEVLKDQDLLERVTGTTFSKQISQLKDLVNSNTELSDLIDHQKAYIGISAGKKDSINYLLCTQIEKDFDFDSFLKKNQKMPFTIRKVDKLYAIDFSDSTSVYLGLKGMLVAISDSKELIKTIIDSEVPKETEFTNFIKSNNTYSKNSLATLFVNYNTAPSLLKPILNTTLTGELTVFNQQNGFSALNYNFSSEKLLFNGTTVVSDPNSYLNLFNQTQNQKTTINELFPISTANYTIYTVDQYQTWNEELKGWIKKQKNGDQILQKQLDIKDRYGLDISKTFSTYFKNQFTTFQLENGEKLGAISLSNGDKVGQFFLDLSSEYSPDIRIFKEANILYSYFGEPFKKFERPYYTIIDNYLIIANYASILDTFLNRYRNNELLISDQEYLNLQNQISSASISYYINCQKSNNLFSRNLKPKAFKTIRDKDRFGQFTTLSFQLSGDKGKFISNFLMMKKIEKVSDTININ